MNLESPIFTDTTVYPISKIENIRDLLVSSIAPELAEFVTFDLRTKYGDGQQTPERSQAITEQMVAFVIDSINTRALEALIAFRKRQEN